ncbi:aminopeptidase [Anaerolineales bacterium HSG24]|nr:aminopeptidase [Anaerolineales bacterium HSG24]
MIMNLTFEQKLRNYADLAVNVGIGLQPGQTLIIRDVPLESAPFVRLIAESAYKAGAKLVDVIWKDDALILTRFQHAPRDSFSEFPTWNTEAVLESVLNRNGATLKIVAEKPGLLDGQDPELIIEAKIVRQQQLQEIFKYSMANYYNWSVISMPIPSWAAKIFPDDAPQTQIDKLWDLIFEVCRVNQPDPVQAWKEHAKTLTEKKIYLNNKKYTSFKYKAPGTELTLGLPEGHIWHGVSAVTSKGINFMPNLPSEEIFTMPHRDQADGVLSNTRPFSSGGMFIDQFSLKFENGRIVNATAKTGETILKQLIATDEGATRLGEIALVPHSSPISQSNVLFYNTLFDENAASHLAIGKAYRFCMVDGDQMDDDQFATAGGNNSLIHEDLMIGSDEMDIDGVTAAGDIEPIMRAGEWAF